jgi:hypothetical protein
VLPRATSTGGLYFEHYLVCDLFQVAYDGDFYRSESKLSMDRMGDSTWTHHPLEYTTREKNERPEATR